MANEKADKVEKSGEGKRSKTAMDAPRSTIFIPYPEELTVVTDPNHPLFDRRVFLPIDEGLVNNIMAIGVKEPILVRKADNDVIEVVDGRQRTRAACEANRRLREAGNEPIRVRVLVEKGTDDDLYGILIATNENRQDDPPSLKAEKLQQYVNRGHTVQEAAIIAGKPVSTVKALLALNDASAAVKEAVDSGKLGVFPAAKLAKLAKASQDTALAEALEAGASGEGLTKAANRVAASRRGSKTAAASAINLGRKDFKALAAEVEDFSCRGDVDRDAAMLVKGVIDFLLTGDDSGIRDRVPLADLLGVVRANRKAGSARAGEIEATAEGAV